jgi:hypothetical protein
MLFLNLLFILVRHTITNKRIRPFQCEQFMCYYIVILPYMFRPILGHHQRDDNINI